MYIKENKTKNMVNTHTHTHKYHIFIKDEYIFSQLRFVRVKFSFKYAVSVKFVCFDDANIQDYIIHTYSRSYNYME